MITLIFETSAIILIVARVGGGALLNAGPARGSLNYSAHFRQSAAKNTTMRTPKFVPTNVFTAYINP